LYKSPNGDIVRVKMGFSWQAFFVGSLSTLVRRGWLLAAVAVIYYAGETFFNGAPTPTSRTAGVALAGVGFYAVYMLFCGVNGNRWLSDSLRRAASRSSAKSAADRSPAAASAEAAVEEPAAFVPPAADSGKRAR
jgi:hypothetical protein